MKGIHSDGQKEAIERFTFYLNGVLDKYVTFLSTEHNVSDWLSFKKEKAEEIAKEAMFILGDVINREVPTVSMMNRNAEVESENMKLQSAIAEQKRETDRAVEELKIFKMVRSEFPHRTCIKHGLQSDYPVEHCSECCEYTFIALGESRKSCLRTISELEEKLRALEGTR